MVLEEMRRIQLEQLAGRSAGDDVKQLRAILCKTAGGIGNRIQGIMSCMMMALATRRALLLQWEREVTAYINDLMAIAEEERNYMARQFLDWFVAEQLEEVSLMGELLQTVRRAGEGNLLAVEQYLVNRPTAMAEPGAAG